MGGISFNADEVFAMAEEIEVSGAKFYRKAAAGAKEKRVKDALTGLAGMEDRHYETFSRMRQQLSEEQRTPTVLDPDNESVMYLKAMADRRVFGAEDPCTKLTGDVPLQAVFQTAIGLEKDSIVFYTGLKDIVPERLGRDTVEGIIREEISHVRILTEEMAKL